MWNRTRLRLELIGRELEADNQRYSPAQSIPAMFCSCSTGSNESTDDTTGSSLNISNNTDNRIGSSILDAIQENNHPHLINSFNSKIESKFRKNVFFAEDGSKITTTNSPEDCFEYLEPLGYGSEGIVAKMRHIETGRVCAVKKLTRTYNTNEDASLNMDLQTVLSCNSEHIVSFCGYFITDTEIWICTELMTMCFDKLLKERQQALPEDCLGAMAVATVKALEYLEDYHNITHRDIKPSNILINDRGDVKICDFGLSGRLINSIARTRAPGCSPYMAPERVDPSEFPYDSRADVWSLGITIFELATGNIPYSDCQTEFDMLVELMHEPAPKLPDDRQFSNELQDFVTVCLTKDRRARPKFKKLMQHEFLQRHLKTRVKLDDLLRQ